MDFKTYFISKWPNEAVGYLKQGEFFPLENLAVDQKHEFEVDPAFLLQEPDVLLHSHITGYELRNPNVDPRSPSFTDLKYQISTDIEWGICVTDGQTCDEPLCWGNYDHVPDLIGREFIFNLHDCLPLARDWLYQNRGIKIPFHAHESMWHEQGEDYIEQLYESWGFQQVQLDELQEGDVLFYQVRSLVVNHVGIYLGNNEVISHWYGRVSCVETFGKWGSHVKFAARYNTPKASE